MGFFRDAYNLAFGKPIEYETLDSWAKVCDDVLKASIIGIPALIFMDLPPLNKLVCGLLLAICIYANIVAGRFIRNIMKMSKNDDKHDVNN